MLHRRLVKDEFKVAPGKQNQKQLAPIYDFVQMFIVC